MPGIDFRAVRSLVSISDVLHLLGFVPLARSGQQMRGRCPLHGSTTKTSQAFSVNLAKNTFRCFKCGKGGNHLDLWASATNQSLHAAAADLCRRLNRTIPWIEAEQRRGTRT